MGLLFSGRAPTLCIQALDSILHSQQRKEIMWNEKRRKQKITIN